GLQVAAAVLARPADDLSRLSAVVATAFQSSGPSRVGDHGPTPFAVPEQHLTLAVTLHAHVHRGKRGSAQFRRAPGVAVAGADAVEEVAPQRGGVVALQSAGDELAGAGRRCVRPLRAVADVLRQDLHAEFVARLAHRPWPVAELDRRQAAADHL